MAIRAPDGANNDNDNEEEEDGSVKIISGKREMNGYYCTLPRNLSHRYVFFFKFMSLVMILILYFFTNYLLIFR